MTRSEFIHRIMIAHRDMTIHQAKAIAKEVEEEAPFDSEVNAFAVISDYFASKQESK